MMSLRQSAVVLKRCFSVNTPAAAAAADPIQSLFADKIREYGDKKAKAGGKLVEASEATLKDLQGELDKVIQAKWTIASRGTNNSAWLLWSLILYIFLMFY